MVRREVVPLVWVSDSWTTLSGPELPGPDAPMERTSAIEALPLAKAPGDSNQKGYFAAINGMSVDDPPSEGFIRGRSFLHPVLRIAFTAPPGFHAALRRATLR